MSNKKYIMDFTVAERIELPTLTTKGTVLARRMNCTPIVAPRASVADISLPR